MADLELMASEGKPVVGDMDVRRLSGELGESEAGTAWRLAALEAYRNEELPPRGVHLWRYTNPLNLLPREALPAAMPPRDLQVAQLPDDQPAILLLPGRAPEMNGAAREAGLTVSPLLTDSRDARRSGLATPAESGYFASLNAAAFNAGVAIRVPAGARLEQPLRVIVPAFAETTLPRLLIDAGAGSELTVVEEHVDGREDHRVIGVTEILVGQNANVRHVLAESWDEGVCGWLSVRARVERDGRYLGASATLGGHRVKLELGADLAGPGARSELFGVVLGGDGQFLDHHTSHRHQVGDTWSDIHFKAVLTGKSRSSYTGLIRIEEGAARSEALQENRNLLLSDTARADSIPELEILTDDVSCSHGATAAPIDPEQVFYLQSRGLGREEAERLVVQGFLEPTLDMVPMAVRTRLDELVQDRLTHLGGAR
ncbi:MAG: Fe-S cluster assembly protein SufD [bacterium]|nr:Fe-S cluster assembly protein SufD [bacterium]